MPESSRPSVFLYEQIARRIARQIQEGTYRPGDRIPSVRQMSRQQEVSISTVLQAYLILENRGLIEARPQSGYYVRAPEFDRLPEPEPLPAGTDPSLVSLNELVMRIVRDMFNPELVQLGGVMPNIELLPTRRLNRSLARLVREAGQAAHQYELPPGLEELRVQIAQRAFRFGCRLAPGDLLITSGVTEAVDLALRAVCRPGDIVAIESPMYFGTLQSLEVHGLRALEIPTHQRDGLSLEALKFAIEHNPVKAVLVISNFNNPLGSSMPDEKKKELVALLAAYDMPLIENDVSGEIFFGDRRPWTAKAYDAKGLVILCSSFSKDISAGLRVGWVAAGRYKPAVEWHKFTANAATATLPQMAVAEFLASGGYDHHLRRIRREYARNMAMLSQAVTRYFPAETRVTRPAGGMVLWVQLPETVDSLALYKLALQDNITIAPGYLFSATEQYANYIRLNAAAWTYPIQRAVERLGELASGVAGGGG
jgi:DNA-binding transcriptional MocR family regulator